MTKGLTRRRFLELAGLTGAAGACYQSIEPTEEAEAQKTWDYREWEDFYRRQFTWDKVVSGSHAPTCLGQCAIDVFVKLMGAEAAAGARPRRCQLGHVKR